MSDEGQSGQDLEKRVATAMDSMVVSRSTVESMSKSLEEFQQLLAKGKKMRWILVIALLFVIGVVVFMMIGLKNKLTDVEPTKLAAIVNERVQAIVETHKEHLVNAVKEAYPQVTEKIRAKISEQAPKLKDKLATEVDMLIENLQKGVDRQIQQALKALERDIRTTVGNEFPDLNDVKVAKMVENFKKAIEAVCIDFSREYFYEHASVLLDIEKTLEKLEATREDNLPTNRQELIDELKAVGVRLFNIKIAQMADAEG